MQIENLQNRQNIAAAVFINELPAPKGRAIHWFLAIFD